LIPSASEISVTEVYTPSSSSFCHRHARERAFRKRAVWLRLPRGHKLAAVRRDDPLAAASALEAHWDAYNERGAVEPRLGALDHAAILSRCRSSATRLGRPAALIRTSSASSCTSTRSTSSWTMRLLGLNGAGLE
jgi:hypothetical protein